MELTSGVLYYNFVYISNSIMKPTRSLSEVLKNTGMLFLVSLTTLSGINVASAQELDQKYDDIVDTIPKPLITNQSSQNGDTKYVRIIYLIPADSIEKPEYILGLENAARHLQMWYYNALGQNKTFALHDPIVEVYQTSHEALWYSTNPNGSTFLQFWRNVLQDGFLYTEGRYNDPNNRWVYYIDANCGCDQCGGCGGSGLVVIGANDLKGLVGYEIDKSCPNVVHSYKSCRYVGGMGHELGHALGLPHPPECDEDFPTCWDHDLMMYGYITYPDAYFNESDKTRLSNSPFIRNIDIEGLYYPSSCMELNDTCNFSTQSEKSVFCGDSILLEGKYQKTSGIYYDTLNSVAGCDTIIITYLSIINPPADAEDVWICEGEPVPDLIAIGENIQWYDDVDLSNLIHSGDTLKTGHTEIGTYTFYVTQTILGCNRSSPVAVTLTISPVPLSPTTEDTVTCEGEYIDYLVADGDNITWYSDAELTDSIWTGNNFYVGDYPTELGKNIFYVTQKIYNCESLPDTVIFTINPTPQAPITEDVTICNDDSSSILIAKGENITWYRDSDSAFIDSRDGQEYRAVKIGNQVWMAENLNYYTSSGSWYYNNDSILYAGIYGRLYDFSTSKNICPSEWHLPSDSEWQEMIDYLGGDSIAAGKLKEQGDDHWVAPNTDATNLSGFTALPAGYKLYDTFFNLGEGTYYWSSRSYWQIAYIYKLTYNSSEITQIVFYANDQGASVRCIKDNVYEIADFGDTLTLSNAQIGSYHFYAAQTISNCESPLDTVTLTINPIPTAPLVDDITVCQGEEIPDLSATGENIQWYTDSELTTLVNSGNSYSTGKAQAGVYSYYVTQTVLSCQGPAESVNLQIHSLPFVDLGNDTTISTNDTMVLDAGNDFVNYSWSDGSSEQTITLRNLNVGDYEYSVSVTNIDDCTNSDTVVIHVILPSTYSISNVLTDINLEVFPNPTSGFLYIKSNSNIETEFTLTLIDILGKVVYKKKIERLDSNNQIKLNLLHLKTGIYILRINNSNLIEIEKMVKK